MMTSLTEDILSVLRRLLPEDRNFLPLHEPQFGGNEWLYVEECINTGWVSSAGKYVDRFEEMLAEYTGTRRAVAVVNGTAALHIALKLAGVERGDEVLVPALTFVATANAVSYCGAIPHFIDSEERTLGVDPWKLREYLKSIGETNSAGFVNRRTGRRIRAIIPMHTFGHPVDIDPVIELCERYGIVVVEDAAESLGSYYKGRHTGSSGKLATISFNGNKVVTTGGGGAILTNDNHLADYAKHLTTTGKMPHRWQYYHDEVAFNYRLPNINAALGCAQLEQLDGFLQRKRALALWYSKEFATLEGLRFVDELPGSRSNYWLNVLLLNRERASERDQVLGATNDNGIMTRPAWTLMADLPMYTECPSMDLSEAKSIESRLINIPSSANLVPPYV